ncbi:organelle RRM domain-containing protein 1, chloroplastic isoform X2 [Silene latifolia]|uniref:organelle RRM domain-containing protein 1, chloroplastic isoform X2 n=1 Tax=Silene latifolia TaxID=37657 RepID=UPI003D787EE1
MEIGLLHTPLTSINMLLASTPLYHLNTPTKHPLTFSFSSSSSSSSSSFNKFQPISTPSSKIITASSSSSSSSPTSAVLPSTSTSNLYWMNALGCDEKDAQMCIYDASSDNTNFGFCCFIDQQTSHVLTGIPGVIAVKPDPDMNSINKDYSCNFSLEENSMLLPEGSNHWLVTVEKPSTSFSKAQMVDFYVDILSKVLGNEKDAQMCLYHAFGQSDYGFCCILDEGCAQELAAVPGVLSVKPDENFDSKNKTYGGGRLSSDALSSAGTDTSKTKLFITGLSFYTSEKTLRTAFEPFGELVEVKIIMDKISKRSKGYAFIEYVTEDAATAALLEMNGKIINGWMIVVDRARSKPRFSKSP